MRASLKFLTGLTSMLALSTATASGGVLLPIIPFPGATSTSVFGITDNDVTIVGSYVSGDDGLTHGFYGTLADGNYTSFDFGDNTQARAIDGTGRAITGFSNITATHCEFVEWEMAVGGNPKQITKDGNPLNGIVMGMDEHRQFAGDYCTDDGVIHGQVGRKFQWERDITVPFDSPYVGERAMNKKGYIVGFYVDSNTGLQVGTINFRGTVTPIHYPDANESYTVFEGLNLSHTATGQWGDTSGIVHSFTYNIQSGKFVEIDDPNAASFTQAWGVNYRGRVAVSSDAGAYIYCQHKNDCPFINGAKAIELNPRVSYLSHARTLRYGDVGHGTLHAPVKLALPKGAAAQ